jgi:hypothetical protein
MFGGWMAYGLHKKNFKWRTEMRKMKKFLAVALSAAMVLSVSVPAMAAEGRAASNTEVAMNQKALDDATKKVEEAEKAFDEAVVELNAARAALEAAKKAAREDHSHKVTPAEVQQAQADAQATVTDIYSSRISYALAKTNYESAKKAEQVALTKYSGAKKAYDAAVTTQKAAQKAYDDATDVDEKAAAATALAIANQNLTDTKAAAEAAKEEYDGESDLTKQGTGGAVANTKIYKTTMDNAETAVKEANNDAREALADAYLMEATYNAQQGTKSAIQELEAKVAECEEKAADAKDALDAAVKEQDAAAAKLSEAGRKVAKDNLYKAQVNEEQKALEEERALQALTGGKERISAIEAVIAQYEQDIEDFDAALIANDEAQDAAAEAAAAVVQAEIIVYLADYALELAEMDSANIPALLQNAKDELNNAIASDLYLTVPNLFLYLAADDNVEDAKGAVQKYTDSYYTQAVAAVLQNATYAKEKADRDYKNAVAAWDKAERDAKAAAEAVTAAFAKYQEAIKALYVTKEITKEEAIILYGDAAISEKDLFDPTYKVYTPVQADAAGNPTENKIYRWNGIYVQGAFGAEGFEPNMVGDVPVSEKPAKYLNSEIPVSVTRLDTNTYAFTDAAGEVIVDWKGDPITTTNSDFRLDFGDPEEDLIRFPQLVDDTPVPTTLYSMLAEAKILVNGNNGLQDQYDKAVKAHKDAAEALGEAEAEYEYYFGNKSEEISKAVEQIIAKFKDVSATDWFASYVADVVDKDIMQGYADGVTFGSYDTLQRQDFVVILWRMAGKPEVNSVTKFKDVEKGSYYEAAVNWAYSTGIVKGYTETEFGVGKNITREDFTVMLYRYNKYPRAKASIAGFVDASKVSGYAAEAVKWAVAAEAIGGKTAADGSKYLDPQAPIARCEAAKILSVITG